MQRQGDNQLYRFFSGLTEYAFEARLGVADPPLVEYISGLLTRFIRYEAIFAVRNLAGRRLQELAEMAVEADARQGDARREVHRHIGDFALFWTGVYPEAIERIQRSNRLDRFLDYRTEGKRAYYLASKLPPQDDAVESELLERLSHDFELCVYGLGEVRREWERRDDAGPQRPILVE